MSETYFYKVIQYCDKVRLISDTHMVIRSNIKLEGSYLPLSALDTENVVNGLVQKIKASPCCDKIGYPYYLVPLQDTLTIEEAIEKLSGPLLQIKCEMDNTEAMERQQYELLKQKYGQ